MQAGFRWMTRCLVCALMCWVVTPVQAAGEYPSKPIRMIVPFPPGSSADVRSRQIAALVAPMLKQQIIVDNRPGAAGKIGTVLAAKSPPDGYTIAYILTNSVCVIPHLYKDPQFNPVRDLTPFIITLRAAPIALVAAGSDMRTLADVVAKAKAAPGKLTYDTSGPGSPQHLTGEQFQRLNAIDMVAVPYKGDAPTLVDLISGQIDLAFGFALASMPLVAAGKLRAIAVASDKRHPFLPDVPTLVEAGMPHIDATIWSGFAVPKATPAAIVRKLHQAFHQVMTTPAFKADVEQAGSELVASSQAEAEKLVTSEYYRYAKIIKDLDIKAE